METLLQDGLPLTGNQVEVRESLFEGLNDEALRYTGTVTNVRIHGNVVRQALIVNSFDDSPTFFDSVVVEPLP